MTRTRPSHPATQRLAPCVRLPHRARPPDPFGIPQSCRAIDRGQRRAARAYALARDDVNLDARLLHRPHAGMVGAVGAGSRQDESSAS